MAHPADADSDGRIGIGEARAAHEAFDPVMKGSRGGSGARPPAGCGWTCGVLLALLALAALAAGLLLALIGVLA